MDRNYKLHEAKTFAILHHSNVNQMYDSYLPYEFHLRAADRVCKRYIEGIPFDESVTLIASVWLHDILEDTHVTYNDLLKVFGFSIAEIVYAVTNEKGKTRAERANSKYYAGIKNTQGATFVKLCDRIANVEYGIMTNSPMLDKYREEQSKFSYELYPQNRDEVLKRMFYDLENLLTPNL